MSKSSREENDEVIVRKEKQRWLKIKSTDDTEDDISTLFESILNRINEKKELSKRIVVLDKDKREAISYYVKNHPNDYIVWGDDE